MWKGKCPIDRLAKEFIRDNVATKKKLNAIEKEILEEIEAAVAFANESEFPTLQEMYEDVYVREGIAE